MMGDKWSKFKTEKSIRTLLISIAAILLLVSGGSYVYAKYFSERAQWGVAIASGVYFTANYASEKEDFFETIVKSDYLGSNTQFTFEVRNYENNLLFNESDVVIPYSLSFWLGEEPVGAAYTVTWQDGEQSATLNVGEAQKVTIDGQSIAGGAAKAVEYVLRITVTTEEVHEAVPIYVEVQTAEGALVNKRLRGKMVLNNTAIPENYIESQGFIVPEETDPENVQFEQIQEQSGFSYEIRTVGEVADEVTEELKLSWNPDVLEIDLFEEAYLEWLESDTKEELETAGTVMDSNGLATDSNGWKYITVKVMPYSAETIVFFRGENFATSITDMESLNAAIEAEKY